MRKKLQEFFWVPPEIRADFWQGALQKNRLSLLVICIMILGMELFNMCRVLFWSTSGLGTLNNRIYFGMYCALWLSAAIYLLLQRWLRRAAVWKQGLLQYGMALFALLWHAGFNSYDLIRNPEGGTGIFTTAVLGLAVFIQMPGLFSVITYILAYSLFMTLSAPILGSGSEINLTITTIVALAVSLTYCRHWAVMVAQQQEIRQMNRQLHLLLQKDPLTGLLNKTAFQSCADLRLTDAEPRCPAALLIADLDDFKAINDRFGHPCGDFVLRETARALQDAFPHAAGIGRIGGDEFAVVLSEPADAPAETACRDLIRSLSSLQWQGHAISASCSIGLCRVTKKGVSYATAYSQADHALYRAKAQGKGTCACTSVP